MGERYGRDQVPLLGLEREREGVVVETTLGTLLRVFQGRLPTLPLPPSQDRIRASVTSHRPRSVYGPVVIVAHTTCVADLREQVLGILCIAIMHA